MEMVAWHKPGTPVVGSWSDVGQALDLGVPNRQYTSDHMPGDKHHSLPKSVSVSAAGYAQIWVGGSKVSFARQLYQDHVRRRLPSDQHVHHRNGDKSDNRLCNLVAISDVAHGRLHGVVGGRPSDASNPHGGYRLRKRRRH